MDLTDVTSKKGSLSIKRSTMAVSTVFVNESHNKHDKYSQSSLPEMDQTFGSDK